jgi:protein-L-isoaspartate(D-aspartate) O-methyltransferase
MDRVAQAFEAMSRRHFLLPENQEYAHVDQPISIGFGQTNSQPSTVRMMLEWLDAQPGQSVLDVGSGSGWTTALLSYLVNKDGKVYAVERIPELLRFGRVNCKRLGIKNVRFCKAGSIFGLSEYAPYDRILVNAAAGYLPTALVNQLKTEGRMVIPIQHTMHVITKLPDGNLRDISIPGFAFVPLVDPAT